MSSKQRNNGRIPTDQEAASLVLAASESSPTDPLLADIFFLLSGWARRCHHNVITEQVTSLTEAIVIARRILTALGPSSLNGSAAVLFLGNAAGALRSRDAILDISEAIGSSLLNFSHSGLPLALPAVQNLISGCTALLPVTSLHPDAACWIFTALLETLNTLNMHTAPDNSNIVEIALQLEVLYSSMTGATLAMTAADQRNANAQIICTPAGHGCLEQLYGLLRVILLPLGSKISAEWSLPRDRIHGERIKRAAASRAAGGILEGLLHGAGRRRAALQPLINSLAELMLCSTNNDDVLGQTCSGLSFAQVLTACRMPMPTPRSAFCCIVALFEAALDIQPLISLIITKPGSGQDVAATSAALAQQAQHGFSKHAAMLLSAATMQLAEVRLRPDDLSAILDVLQRSAMKVHQQYRQYILRDWSQHAAGVDHRPLQTILFLNFTASMEILAALSVNKTRNIGNMGGVPPSAVLSIAAELQFCRTASSHYAPLLKTALQVLPVEPSSAADVATHFPPYSELEARSPVYGNAPVWLVDGLSAAKTQLLFTALAPCCGALPEDVVLNTLAPLAFLYLLHPHQGTVGAAHQMLWAVMATQPQHAQQLIPYYVTRCLENIPGELTTSANSSNGSRGNGSAPDSALSSSQSGLNQQLQNLSQGLSTAFAALPVGSPVAVLCVERLLGKCRELSAAGSCWDDSCIGLYEIAVQQLLTVDYSMTNVLSRSIEQLIVESPKRLQPRFCEVAAAVVSGTEDYVRKPNLAAWYQQLAASL